MPFIPRPARAGSILAALAPRPRPICSAAATKAMRQAERDPALDLYAEAILRALLFKLARWSTGACAPSLPEIAAAAKCSRATVCDRLPKLGRYLRQVRRMVEVPADPAAGWCGPMRRCQITTAYYFELPAVAELAGCESSGQPPRLPKILNLPLNRAREAGAGLEAALARLGQGVRGRPV